MISPRLKFRPAGGVSHLTRGPSSVGPFSPRATSEKQSPIFTYCSRVRGRYSRRESANRGPYHAATSSKLEPCCLMGALWIRCAERYATESGRVGGISTPATGVALQDRVRKSNKQSILDTAWLATYSSLRRKKSTRQAGEMRFHPRRLSGLLVRVEPSTFEWLL